MERKLKGRLRNILLARYTDLTPMGRYHPDDIFIISYPKSGSNWLRTMFAGIIHGLDLEYAQPALVSELVPGHKTKYYKRFQTPMFFRFHALLHRSFRRVIYLIRDGRDAIVSYHHHTQTVKQKSVDLLDVVEGREFIQPFNFSWAQHVRAWQGNPFKANLITVRYEDLLTDTVGELGRLLEFAGIETGTDGLEGIAKAASFEKMREREKRLGNTNSAWPPGQQFMRRGIAGSHKDEKSAEALRAFLDQSAQTLTSLGYLTPETPQPL